MVLTWTDNSDDEAGFQASNGDDSRAAPAHPGTGTVAYTWTGLRPNHRTCFRVWADNGDTVSGREPGTAPYYRCAYTSVAAAR